VGVAGAVNGSGRGTQFAAVKNLNALMGIFTTEALTMCNLQQEGKTRVHENGNQQRKVFTTEPKLQIPSVETIMR